MGAVQEQTRADIFQPMPELTPEQYGALRADIAENGVVNPVVLDQYGRILDGHNRVQIAESLGIEYPTIVQAVESDEDAMNKAVALNCARRHLTREQQREVIRKEILRRPGDSDRAIARRVGCSPTTVGRVRNPKPQVSNLDTWQPPRDVNPHDFEIVDRLFSRYNVQPDLPQSDEDYEWAQTAILYDADNPLWFNAAIAVGADRLELVASVVGKMALWKARGMDRKRIRRLFDSWIWVALSDSECQKIAAEFGDFVSTMVDNPEFLAAALDFTASVPRYPSEVNRADD